MNPAAGAAVSSGAAAAAAAEAQRRQQEEEEMTPYSEQDLRDGWEFKILRSATGAFKHPEKLNQALDEEARAGWVMVEKFDNGRVRLKRPASAKRDDATLEFDPYRTTWGTTEGRLALAIVAIVLGVIIALAAGFLAAANL